MELFIEGVRIGHILNKLKGNISPEKCGVYIYNKKQDA